MKQLAILAVLLLAGCQSQFQTETVYLRNKAGENVVCGPYSAFTFSPEQENRLRVCVIDYQKAGYDRYQPTKK